MRRAARSLPLVLALVCPTLAFGQTGGVGSPISIQRDSRPLAPDAETTKQPKRVPPPRPTTGGRLLELTGFAHFGSLSFAAHQSFDAILGQSSGRILGGGGEIAFLRGPLRHVFVRVDASRFSEKGERVFVFQGEVFKLGIPETITVTPIELTAGYRLVIPRKGKSGGPGSGSFPVVPYAGLGVGALKYRETGSFAEPGDDVDQVFTSYHVVGGADVRVWRWIGAAVEGVYRWVPDALGSSGVSQAFNETNLDGATVRVRLRVSW